MTSIKHVALVVLVLLPLVTMVIAQSTCEHNVNCFFGSCIEGCCVCQPGIPFGGCDCFQFGQPPGNPTICECGTITPPPRAPTDLPPTFQPPPVEQPPPPTFQPPPVEGSPPPTFQPPPVEEPPVAPAPVTLTPAIPPVELFCSQESCNDNDACTRDYCLPGGNFGVSNTRIDSGGCVNVYVGQLCNDFDACTYDYCDSEDGCQHEEVLCNDENLCTADNCDSECGCVYTDISETCDDKNVCTDDYCVPDEGCVNIDISFTCDDDNLCTTDHCHPVHGCINVDVSADCNDENECTIDFCDPSKGCVNEEDESICDDENACTEDNCDSSRGCNHVDISETCDDADLCTADSCDPSSGCIFEDISHLCDDGDECTTDFCDGELGCQATSPCDDDDVCTLDTCELDTESSVVCVYEPCVTSIVPPPDTATAICATAGADTGIATIESNCFDATEVTITFVDTGLEQCGSAGCCEVTRTWTVSDACGTISSAAQAIQVFKHPAEGFALLVESSISLRGLSAAVHTIVRDSIASGSSISLAFVDVGTPNTLSLDGRIAVFATTSIQVNEAIIHSGDVVAGGALLTSNYVHVSGADQQFANPLPIDIPSVFIVMDQLSAALAALAPTGVVSGTTNLVLTGVNPGLNVFLLSGLGASIDSVTINVPANSTALINVQGVIIQPPIGFTDVVSTDGVQVLYNMYQALNIFLNQFQFSGTVLAPLSTMSADNGAFLGTVIVQGPFQANNVELQASDDCSLPPAAGVAFCT